MTHVFNDQTQRNNENLQSLQNAVGIAKMFAEISRQATERANARRLEAAGRNIELGTAQLELAESVERRRIAQALARHSGISRVNAAFRGTAGGQSTEQLQVGARSQAAQSVAVVSANVAFRVQQLINQNIVDLDDPDLAAFEGGLRGFNIGMSIQASLDSLATSQIVRGTTIFTTPELNLGDLISGDFDFESLLNL